MKKRVEHYLHLPITVCYMSLKEIVFIPNAQFQENGVSFEKILSKYQL